MAIKKSDSIAATGAGGSVVIRKGWLSISGTWVGTINLQVDVNNNDTWSNATDQTGTAIALTQNTNCPIDNAVAMKTRAYFTRTSGTAVVTLIGVA